MIMVMYIQQFLDDIAKLITFNICRTSLRFRKVCRLIPVCNEMLIFNTLRIYLIIGTYPEVHTKHVYL